MKTAALDAAVLLLAALTLASWFAAWPPVLPAALPAGGLLVLVAARLWPFRPRRWPAAKAETLACLGLAMLYRLPAVLHPWGWVNTDGAYAGFVAHHLLSGERPAPVFTEGASYQGTLKGHLAALLMRVRGIDDLSLAVVLASLLLTLLFLVATMALARRIGGRGAALGTGLYLALGPKFLTVFTLNAVGQYVDVLALGGIALALLAAVIEGSAHPLDRLRLAAVGALLGAAFWQQPVALAYVATAALVLLAWREQGRPSRLWALGGLAVGALPVLLWNLRHDWASGDVLGRDPASLRAHADALPQLVTQTVALSFPVLAGAGRGHPWWGPALRLVATALIPSLLAAFLLLRGRAIALALRRGRPVAATLPPLLLVASLGLFWAVAAGAVYFRPRYLLPVMAATSIHLGVALAALARRARPAAMAVLGVLVAVNVAGTVDRLGDGGATADYYARVIRSLEDKAIRTGYADFSLSAPVTLFTGERILLSSRLGPTPSYEPEDHTERVARDGPDAYVLRPDDDPEQFAAVLRRLGVSYRLDPAPVPVFYGFSRRVRLEEVVDFRGEAPPEEALPVE